MMSALPKHFVSLNKVEDGRRLNIFGIVKNVVKPETVLKNKSRHTLLALIDPSCYEESPKREDLLLHIFLNNKDDKFVEPFEQGDILRIREIVGEYYPSTGHTHGKIFRSSGVVKFKSFEEEDEITPITSSSVYQLNGPDIAQIKHLRTWWDTVKDGVILQVEKDCERESKGGDDALAKRICDIKEEQMFDLYCKIKEISHLDQSGFVVLRVIDGTLASSAIAIINVNEIEGSLTPPRTAELNSSSIWVIVKEPVETARRLKVDDYVRLEYVLPMLIGMCEVDSYELPAFIFMMKKNECDIRKLTYLKPEKAEAIGQMEEKVEGEKRILKIRLNEAQSTQSAETNDSSQTEQIDTEHPLSNTTRNGELTSSERMNSDENEHNNASDTDWTKGKSNEELKAEVRAHSVKYVSWQSKIKTECPTYPRCSLKKLEEEMEECVEGVNVWAFLQRLHCIRDEHNIAQSGFDGSQCCKDWVWGECLSCQTRYSSTTLRSTYDEEVLENENCLQCPKVRCQENSRGESGQLTVVPKIVLRLWLTGLAKDKAYPVYLSGESAAFFFDAAPSFKWCVQPISDKLRTTIDVFVKAAQTFPLCFTVVKKGISNSLPVLQIRETVFRPCSCCPLQLAAQNC